MKFKVVQCSKCRRHSGTAAAKRYTCAHCGRVNSMKGRKVFLSSDDAQDIRIAVQQLNMPESEE